MNVSEFLRSIRVPSAPPLTARADPPPLGGAISSKGPLPMTDTAALASALAAALSAAPAGLAETETKVSALAGEVANHAATVAAHETRIAKLEGHFAEIHRALGG